MNEEFSQLWEMMTPEEQNQMLAMGTLDERQAQMERQRQQAELLRQGSGQQYNTGMGAALGGLADVIRAGQGQYQLENAEAGIQDILGKKDAGRKSYGNLMQRFAQQQAQQARPPTPDVMPALPVSF